MLPPAAFSSPRPKRTNSPRLKFSRRFSQVGAHQSMLHARVRPQWRWVSLKDSRRRSNPGSNRRGTRVLRCEGCAHHAARAERPARAPTSDGSSPASTKPDRESDIAEFLPVDPDFPSRYFSQKVDSNKTPNTASKRTMYSAWLREAALSQQCNSGLSILGLLRCGARRGRGAVGGAVGGRC